jgi:hypothetical protein
MPPLSDKTQITNTFVPEWSNGPVLGFVVDHPITAHGFDSNFMPRVQAVLDKYGEVRLVVHFRAYKGWEEDAAQKDMGATLAIGKYFTKIALVNASERLVALFKVKQVVMPGEIRFFAESELQQALDWANTPLEKNG